MILKKELVGSKDILKLIPTTKEEKWVLDRLKYSVIKDNGEFRLSLLPDPIAKRLINYLYIGKVYDKNTKCISIFKNDNGWNIKLSTIYSEDIESVIYDINVDNYIPSDLELMMYYLRNNHMYRKIGFLKKKYKRFGRLVDLM
jgi:hypothetical protein